MSISCARHNDRPATLYCTSCELAICYSCVLTTHFNHERQDVGEFVEQRRVELRDHIVAVEHRQRQVDNEVNRVRRASDKLIRTHTSLCYHLGYGELQMTECSVVVRFYYAFTNNSSV